MMKPKLLDTIALLVPISHDRLSLVESGIQLSGGLPVGLVGTIVHIHHPEGETPKYWVEFSDAEGREEAMATLDETELVVLQYELAAA
ncbi:MAG: DUF4926 domain-containing protein [Synechococcales bacterium]|nr:DUF4926 domain-containing protein [Synechococcales bacterium]